MDTEAIEKANIATTRKLIVDTIYDKRTKSRVMYRPNKFDGAGFIIHISDNEYGHQAIRKLWNLFQNDYERLYPIEVKYVCHRGGVRLIHHITNICPF